MKPEGRWAVPRAAWVIIPAISAFFLWGCWQWGRFMGRAKPAIEYTEIFPDLVRELRAEVAALETQRERLRQEIALLERERADWQIDNPRGPGGTPWPAPGEVPRHPLLWPDVQEALAWWRSWARGHPDRAAASLAAEDPEELRQAREELRNLMKEFDAALAP
jgi:hypothetical protein